MSCSNIKAVNQPWKEIKSIYLMQISDCVFEGDTMVRVKRKYGKYKRPIIRVK